MKLSIIVVSYNVQYFLEVCLHSAFRAIRGLDAEILVVDNASNDGSCQLVKTKFPKAILIENTVNAGFSKANNQAVAIAKGKYILFLNPDTVMPENFFEKIIPYMDAHPNVGSLGPRLIDGKGQFAPDAKKSFPTLSVALFKTTGINKVFSKSPYFNKYYAVHVGERETAPVEVLSGCCMLVRASAMAIAGGPFDEDYFMYCEDVDLSYRIHKAGFQNIYFPEADLIHYKGESTRKMTLSYIRIFNDALITFVRKHYSQKDAQLFVLFIKLGITLRAVMGAVKNALKLFHMPLLDAIILLITLFGMMAFWVSEVKGMPAISATSVYATFPAYIIIWLISLYFNSAYDAPYRPLKVVRGMLLGLVVILAYYGLLPPEYRYSRAIIIFTGIAGTVGLLGVHEILYRLGILRFVPYDKLPKKAVIVADETTYAETASILQQVHYAPEVSGRIGVSEDRNALGSIHEMQQLLYTTAANEVIFCVNGLTYTSVLTQMQQCGPDYEYKIHIKGSRSFVGSNSSNTSGDLYTIDRSFKLADFAQLRNKRVLDVAVSVAVLLLFPLLAFKVKNIRGLVKNGVQVLFGKRSWVGYAPSANNKLLPPLRPAILPPYNQLSNYKPAENVLQQMNIAYAQHYTVVTDINLIISNLRYLGNYTVKG